MSLPQATAARAAIERARDEARSMGHEFLGTEHVLLGLLHDPSPEVAFVLSQLSLAAGQVRHELSGRLSPSQAEYRPRELPKTPRLARALHFAEQEALAFEQAEVGAEHLFLGLLREEEGVAAEALAAVGVTLAAAREAVGRGCGREYRGSPLRTEPAPAPPAPAPPVALPPAPSVALPPSRPPQGKWRLEERVAELERGLWEQQVFFGAMVGAAAGVAGHRLFDLIRVAVGWWALFGLIVGALVSATGRFVVGAWAWGLTGLCLGAGLSSQPVLSTGGATLGFLVGVFVGLNLTRWRFTPGGRRGPGEGEAG